MLSVPGGHPGHQEATIGAVHPATVVRPGIGWSGRVHLYWQTSYGPRGVGRSLTFRKSVASVMIAGRGPRARSACAVMGSVR